MAEVDPRLHEPLRAALHRSLEELFQDGYKEVKPHAVAFHALENAMETLRRIPDREAAWLKGGGSWPAVVATDGGYVKTDMETQLALILHAVLTAGEDEGHRTRSRVTREDVDQMSAVFEAFRTNLAGKRQRRDWKILCLSAAGKGQKFVARISEASPETVRQEKLAQTAAIAKALAEFMPPTIGGRYRMAA